MLATLADISSLDVPLIAYVVNALIIGTFTVFVVLHEVEQRDRPFPWLAIMASRTFVLLVLFQTIFVFLMLLALAFFGRAALWPAWDAIWVGPAGLALLQSIPGPKSEGTQRLGKLVSWLFKKFYQDIQFDVIRESKRFQKFLETTYAERTDEFLEDVESFIEGSEEPVNVSAEKERIKLQFNEKTSNDEKVSYLASYIAPRTTKSAWHRLTGK